MAIYRKIGCRGHPKCRGEKSGEMHHLLDEMKTTVFRHAAAITAGALAAFLVGAVPATATEPSSPPVVSAPATVIPPAAGSRPAARTATKAPPRSSLTPAETQPTGAEIVGKLLSPGASDPDVPLPHPDLAERSDPAPESLSGPKLFGRGESGGGVIGLRMPIPVDRSGSTAATRSSGSGARNPLPSQGLLEAR